MKRRQLSSLHGAIREPHDSKGCLLVISVRLLPLFFQISRPLVHSVMCEDSSPCISKNRESALGSRVQQFPFHNNAHVYLLGQAFSNWGSSEPYSALGNAHGVVPGCPSHSEAVGMERETGRQSLVSVLKSSL